MSVALRIALLLLGLLAAGCDAESRGSRPNLLLVSIDTLRADHTGLSGYARLTTPRLVALAAEGVHFSAAYTVMPTTGPTHASMFTGQYPATHGVVWNGMRLADDSETIAERLAAAGYQTAAIVSSFPLASSWGYAQGFEVYHDDFDEKEASVSVESWRGAEVPAGFDRRAARTTAKAIQWLESDRDPTRPFFLFVHYFDPHAPYDPPPGYEDRIPVPGSEPGPVATAVALYDREIAYVDDGLGRLLDRLSDLDLDTDTLVAVTADHGEGLMQHGHLEHGIHLYEEAVRVPLVLRWKGVLPEARSIPEPVSLVDLAATLLDLLGVSYAGAEAGAVPGTSHAMIARGDGVLDAERPIFLHRRRYEPQQVGRFFVQGEQWGIRRGNWKLIVGEGGPEGGEQVELYRLDIDPKERTSVASYHPDRVASLRAELEAWKRATDRGSSAESGPSPDERAALKALGYVE